MIRYLLFAIFSASAVAATELYVSPAGSDTAPGTKDKPFATIARARDRVREIVKASPGDVVVYLRGGTYRITETVVFSAADSMPAGRTATYRAFPGETPVVSASVPVAGWKQETVNGKNLWTADVSQVLALRKKLSPVGTGPVDSRIFSNFFTLYDAGGELPRARSAGFHQMKLPADSKTKPMPTISFPKGAMRNWPDAAGAELIVIPRQSWIMNILPIESVNESAGLATTSLPPTWELDPGHMEHPTAWVENVLDVLDEPGEWVLHANEKKLYCLPRTGKPEGIEAPVLTEIIRVEGKIDYAGPTDVPVRGIVFQGITFTHGDRMPWNGGTGMGLQHDWEMFDRATALVRFRGAEDCAVIDCRFAASGHGGVRADLYAQKIRIEGSVFEQLGGCALLLAGYGPGTKDVNRNNTVVNNHMHHVGRHYWGTPAVFAWQSGENRIANNAIHHVPYAGVAVTGRILWNRNGSGECAKTIRWQEVDRIVASNVRPDWQKKERFLHGRKNLVEHNDIHNVMEIMSDGNAIYVSGTGGGNIIRENFCHDNYGDYMNAIFRSARY